MSLNSASQGDPNLPSFYLNLFLIFYNLVILIFYMTAFLERKSTWLLGGHGLFGSYCCSWAIDRSVGPMLDPTRWWWRRPDRQSSPPPASPSLLLRGWIWISCGGWEGGKRAFASGSDGGRRTDFASLSDLIKTRATDDTDTRERIGRFWSDPQ